MLSGLLSFWRKNIPYLGIPLQPICWVDEWTSAEHEYAQQQAKQKLALLLAHVVEQILWQIYCRTG